MGIIYVKLEPGGLTRNIENLYPSLYGEKLDAAVKYVLQHNQDVLYTPNAYNVGTVVAIDETVLFPPVLKVPPVDDTAPMG
jgi:hypothetical protein